jgi:hypothetical protein
MGKGLILALTALLGTAAPFVAFAATCEIVDGAKRVPFDGKSLESVMIEKKSLTILNAEFPALNVIEKTFKGEIQTCTLCAERHIVCAR